MIVQKQIVFVTNADSMQFRVRVWESRSDAMREVNGDITKILARHVQADSGKGPYRKPLKSAKKKVGGR
jgi:hypothetical protein